MKSLLRLTITVVAFCALHVSATTIWFGGDGSVTNAGNWDNGLPNRSDNVGEATSGTLQGSGGDFDNMGLLLSQLAGIEISDDLELTLSDIFLTENSGLVANGNQNIVLGSGAGGAGFIQVQGASLVVGTGGNLTLGGLSDGQMGQFGGQVIFQNGVLTLGGSVGRGQYDLVGGELTVGDLQFATISSWINFGSTNATGILKVDNQNHSIADIEANIANGNIRISGNQVSKSLFSITDEGGFITVGVVPEPAVAGLLGIGGASMILWRRIFGKKSDLDV